MVVEECPRLRVMSIRNGFSLSFCSLALCRKGHVSSTTNWTLLSRRDRASAWWSTRLWVRELHPVFEQDMAWRRVVSCRQPLPCHIPPTSSVASCDPRLLPKVSLHCVCVFIKLHITAQSGQVILVILCYSH